MRFVIPALILFLLLFLPLMAGTYTLHLMILIFLYAYLGQSWNIVGGYAGQLSLGHALYFGLKSHFFALATIAFAEVFRLFANTIQAVGGAQGLLLPLKGNAPSLYQFVEKTPYYYIALAMMIFSMGVAYLLERSQFGYYLVAIRENEQAAKALGINTVKYKTSATGLSAFLTALGGSFYAQYVLYIDPAGSFGILVSIDIILRAIIGGMGTILGPAVGSFVLSPLSEIIQSIIGVGRSGVYMMVYGAILMAVCLVMPNGIVPYFQKSTE
jgi:branched-chain amino acid transport system permease protein